MVDFTPVDHDPFAAAEPQALGPQLTPVDHDPFAPPPAAPKPFDWSRYLKQAGSGIAKGATTTMGLPGDLQNLIEGGLDKYLLNPIIGAAGGKPLPVSGSPLSSAKLLGATDAAGITNRPELAPQTTGEKYLVAGSEGLGSAGPFAALAGPAGAVRAAAQGIGSGVGGQAGEDATGGSWWGRLIGSLAGGIGTDAATKTAAKVGNVLMGEKTPLMQAYDTAGITPRLAGDVTGNRFLQGAQAIGAKLPGGGGIADAASEVVGDFAKSVERRASMLGAAQTPQEAGEVLQSASKDWLQNFRSQSSKLWNGLDMRIGGGSAVPVGNYGSELEQITKAMPDAPATAKVLQSALGDKLSNALKVDASTGGFIADPTLSWQTVKQLRSRLGEYLSDPGLVADAGTAEIKRLYGALSKDMEAAAAAQGPKVAKVFADANAYTRNGHEFIESTLNNVAGKGVNPEQAFQYAVGQSNAGGSRFSPIRAQMPNAADEIAGANLSRMAAAAPGKATEAGQVSPSTFLTNWNKMSPEAKAAMYPSAEARAHLDALALVAGSMRKTEALANHSGTTHGTKFAELPRTMIEGAAAGGYTGHEMFGPMGAMVGAGLGATVPVIPGLAARALTASPSGMMSMPWVNRLLASPGIAQDLPPALRWGGLLGVTAPQVAGQVSRGLLGR